MAKGLIQDTTLTAIGNAIRAKTGGTDLILPSAMPDAIASIQAGSGGDSSGSDLSNCNIGSVTNPNTYARPLQIPSSVSSESIKFLMIQDTSTNYRTHVYLKDNAPGKQIGDYFYMPVLMIGMIKAISNNGNTGWSLSDSKGNWKTMTNIFYCWALRRDSRGNVNIGYYESPPGEDLSQGWTEYSNQYTMTANGTVYYLYE